MSAAAETASRARLDASERERAARQGRRWVRLACCCNNRCVFCLDAGSPREPFVPLAGVLADLEQGRREGAARAVLSGGEGTLHPEYLEVIRAARRLGYARVQAITNGWKLADRTFYEACVNAGLDEMTFSLHGDGADLHDAITRTPGSFRRIVKSIARAARDPRVVCNIDVVICRLNAGRLDRVVELAIALGVREFDLLMVVPHGAAWENAPDVLFDPAAHLDILHRVLRLGRHPGFTIWTNRLAAACLEGFEEFVQDPHKLLDEIRGRRAQFDRYLREGAVLDCRHPDRCRHCFVLPFCTWLDHTLERTRLRAWEAFRAAGPPPGGEPFPFGCTRLASAVPRMGDLPRGIPLLAEVHAPESPPEGADLVLVARRPDQLDAWIGRARVDVVLGAATAPWLLAHREELVPELHRVRLHVPGHGSLEDEARGLPDPAGFFRALDLPIRVDGLPPCLVPGAAPAQPRTVLDAALFDEETGFLDPLRLGLDFATSGWRVRSSRCEGCAASGACDGLRIGMVRARGLRLVQPIPGAPPSEVLGPCSDGAGCLAPGADLAWGRDPEPPPPPLPAAWRKG